MGSVSAYFFPCHHLSFSFRFFCNFNGGIAIGIRLKISIIVIPSQPITIVSGEADADVTSFLFQPLAGSSGNVQVREVGDIFVS